MQELSSASTPYSVSAPVLSKRSVKDEWEEQPRAVETSSARAAVKRCSASAAMRPFASARLQTRAQPAGSVVVVVAAVVVTGSFAGVAGVEDTAGGAICPASEKASGSFASAFTLAFAEQPIIPASNIPPSILPTMNDLRARAYHLSGILMGRLLPFSHMSSTAYRTTNAPTNLPYSETRQKHVLVRREPARGVVAILLRPAEPAATHDTLRALGYAPEFAADVHGSTWIGDLDGDLARLHEALGSAALFDLGPVFHDVADTLEAAPAGWPGRFVLHVGGTQRCIVFEDASRRDLEPIVRREIEDYFVREWTPATE